MKLNAKKLLVMIMVLLLCSAMTLAMPVSAYAQESGVAQTKGLVLMGDRIEIDTSDADMTEQPVYSWSVSATGTAVTSYQIRFAMPSFIEIEEIVAGDEVFVGDTALFTYYVGEDGIVNVAFSSSVNVAYGALFTVKFTVKDYAPAYGAIEMVDARFVNIDAQTVKVIRQDLGSITIGKPGFAMKGDVDGNGEVNLADLLIIQRSIVNPNYTLSEQQYHVADVYPDGIVDIVDCQYIQNYLVGLIDSLENLGNSGEQSVYELGVEVRDQNGMIL